MNRRMTALPLLTLSSLTLCLGAGSAASADPLPVPLPAPLPTLSTPELPALGILPVPLPVVGEPAPAPTTAPPATPAPHPTTATPVAKPPAAPAPRTVKAAAAHQPTSSAALSAASLMNPPARDLSAPLALGPAVAPVPAAPSQVVPATIPQVQITQAANHGDEDLPGSLVVLASLLVASAGTVNVVVRRRA